MGCCFPTLIVLTHRAGEDQPEQQEFTPGRTPKRVTRSYKPMGILEVCRWAEINQHQAAMTRASQPGP